MQQATIISSTPTPSQSRALLLPAQQGTGSFGKVEGVSIGIPNETELGWVNEEAKSIKMLLSKLRIVLLLSSNKCFKHAEDHFDHSLWATVQPRNECWLPKCWGELKYTLLQNSNPGCRTASSHKGIYGKGKETSGPRDSGEEHEREVPLNYQTALSWCTYGFPNMVPKM